MEKDDYKKAQSDLKKARTAYQNQLKLHKKNNGDAESLLKSKENYLACQLNVLQLSGDEQNKSKAQAFIQAKEKKEILENMIQQMKADPHYEMLQKVEQQYQKSSDTYQVEYKKAATDPNQQRKLDKEMSKLTKEYHQEVEEITELLLDKTKDVYQVVKKEADNINKKYKHAEVDMNQSISKILYEQKTKERKEKLAHLALSFVAHPLVGPALLGFFHHAKNNQPTKQVEETSSPKIKR